MLLLSSYVKAQSKCALQKCCNSILGLFVFQPVYGVNIFSPCQSSRDTLLKVGKDLCQVCERQATPDSDNCQDGFAKLSAC